MSVSPEIERHLAEMEAIVSRIRKALGYSQPVDAEAGRIQQRVADYYRLSVTDLTGRRRPANIAFARQVAMYLCRSLTSMSLTAIGEAFGGRDQSTVLHACRVVSDTMSIDRNITRKISGLKSELEEAAR